jgi:hypothetical protein
MRVNMIASEVAGERMARQVAAVAEGRTDTGVALDGPPDWRAVKRMFVAYEAHAKAVEELHEAARPFRSTAMALFLTASGDWKRVPAPWGDGDPFDWLADNGEDYIKRYGDTPIGYRKLPVFKERVRLDILTLGSATNPELPLAAVLTGNVDRGDCRGVGTVLLLEGWGAIPHLVKVADAIMWQPSDSA